MPDNEFGGLGVDLTCPVCGRNFARLTEDWAYKSGEIHFCSWKCLCDYREKKTGDRLGRKDPDQAYQRKLAKERERGARRRAEARRLKEVRFEVYDEKDIIPEDIERDDELEEKK